MLAGDGRRCLRYLRQPAPTDPQNGMTACLEQEAEVLQQQLHSPGIVVGVGWENASFRTIALGDYSGKDPTDGSRAPHSSMSPSLLWSHHFLHFQPVDIPLHIHRPVRDT